MTIRRVFVDRAVVDRVWWPRRRALGTFQPPPAGQEGIRAGDGAAARPTKLPAAPLLVTAYAFVWVAVMVYLWTIWRRLNKVETEMQALEQRRAGAPRGDGRALHLHPVGAAGRRRDRLDSRLARRARCVRGGAEDGGKNEPRRKAK